MAKDHYVPKVYLKSFTDPNIGNKLHCYRKVDLKYFNPHPRDILATPAGNVLKYSLDPSELERLAAWIEPSLDRIRSEAHSKKITEEVRMKLSFFVAYLTIASPTFMRCTLPILNELLRRHVAKLDEVRVLPRAPLSTDSEYSGLSVSELIASGRVKFKIDPDIARTFAISNVDDVSRKIFNGRWTFLEAPLGSRFVTSDFPATFVDPPFVGIRRRFLPLDPHLAIEVLPAAVDKQNAGGNFGSYVFCSSNEVRRLNRLMIMGAENLVVSSQKSYEIETLVAEMRDTRTEIST